MNENECTQCGGPADDSGLCKPCGTRFIDILAGLLAEKKFAQQRGQDLRAEGYHELGLIWCGIHSGRFVPVGMPIVPR